MHADAVAAWAASLQTGLLAAAAGFAWRQVTEARKSREAQAQPYVVVSFEQDPYVPAMAIIVIANIGATVAKNVSVDFDPPLESAMEAEGSPSKFSEWTALPDGISTLVPGQKVSSIFDSLYLRYSDKYFNQLPRQAKATVKYNDESGKCYDYEYNLDFDVFHKMYFNSPKSIEDVAKAVEDVARTLKSWTESSSGVTVYTKGLDVHRKERSEASKQYMSKRAQAPAVEPKKESEEQPEEQEATTEEAE